MRCLVVVGGSTETHPESLWRRVARATRSVKAWRSLESGLQEGSTSSVPKMAEGVIVVSRCCRAIASLSSLPRVFRDCEAPRAFPMDFSRWAMPERPSSHVNPRCLWLILPEADVAE